MPYIKKSDRAFLTQEGTAPRNPGELNYAITLLLIEYMNNSPGNYQAINDVMGAVEGAKMEFYRRFAAPYEDKKIRENGDVYESVAR